MFWYKYALTLHRKYCIKHTYAKKVLFVGNSNLSILYFIWPYPQISCCSSLLCIFFFVFVTNTLCCCYLVTQSCPTLCHPMDCNTLGLPVLHCLLELAQTHVHLISDVKQSFYPLSSPSPPTFNLSQHQGLFQWVGSLHQVAQVSEFQLQHQSFQCSSIPIFQTCWRIKASSNIIQLVSCGDET